MRASEASTTRRRRRSSARTAENLENLAVDRYRDADAARAGRVHRVFEVRYQPRLAVQPPVGEHPHQVSVDSGSGGFLDDERTVNTAA